MTDGILILRHLAGFTGNSLIADAVNSAGTRTTPGEIQLYLESLTSTSSASESAIAGSAIARATSTRRSIGVGGSDSLHTSQNASHVELTLKGSWRPIAYALQNTADDRTSRIITKTVDAEIQRQLRDASHTVRPVAADLVSITTDRLFDKRNGSSGDLPDRQRHDVFGPLAGSENAVGLDQFFSDFDDWQT